MVYTCFVFIVWSAQQAPTVQQLSLKSKSKEKRHVASLKQNVSLFPLLYVSCQVRDGNLDTFFNHENQDLPQSLSTYGDIRRAYRNKIRYITMFSESVSFTKWQTRCWYVTVRWSCHCQYVKISCSENISWIFPASVSSFFKVAVIGTESSINYLDRII